jgi:hypothetical protein
MIWTAILIASVIGLAALFYVVWPLLAPRVPPYQQQDDRLIDLINRKDVTLAAIKDLEFDYHVGKISEEDFQRFNERLRRQAMIYMQQIEKHAPEVYSMDDALEAEIARQRQSRNGIKRKTAPVAPAPEPAVQITCAHCGNTLSPSQKFCGECGSPVSSVAAATN